MISNELLDQLHGLNRADKLRIIQLLANELARTESDAVVANVEYEVWSPQDEGDVSATLTRLLEQDSEHGA